MNFDATNQQICIQLDWPYMLIGMLIMIIAITIATTIKIALIMGELIMFIFFIRLSYS